MQWAKIGRNRNDAVIDGHIDFFKDNSEYVYHAYCPCCDEQLQIVHRKDGTPHFFRHNKTTPETKLCENRVYLMHNNLGSNNCYHPIMPVVPLFLVGKGLTYHLEVGFNPIPIDLIPSDNSYLTIGSNKFLLKNINNWFFRREIEKIPDCYSNLHLDYSSDCTSEVKRINGLLVDSLECGWGFFNTESGKKVHSGSCLYINQKYYLLAKNEKSIPPILKSNPKCKFQDSEYKIYVIDFSNLQDFSSVKPFLEQEKISLREAEKHSQVLWPPCTCQYGVMKPCKSNTDIFIWADNPHGSRMYSESNDVDGIITSECILRYSSIKEPSIIDIEFNSTREDFDFSPLLYDDLLTTQELSIVFEDDLNRITDTYCNRVKTIHFNFNATVEIYSKNGQCEHRHVRRGVLENNSNNIRLDVYSKYRFINVIKKDSKSDQKISVKRTDLFSYPRVKTPMNLDSILIKLFSNDPVKARLIKQSCSNGTISKRILDKIMLGE